MSNPTVSFRISDYHLARGLRAIRLLDPSWELTTPSDLIRTIFNDYIAKSEFHSNTPLDIDPKLLTEVNSVRTTKQVKQTNFNPLPQLKEPNQRELNEQKIFNQIKEEHKQEQEQALQEQIALTFPDEQPTKPLPKPSEFNDPNITDSEISTVTDFSPPDEWKE